MRGYAAPEILYKYLDYQGAEKTLEYRTIKFSRPSHLNDPLDLNLQEALGFEEREFFKKLNEEFFKFVTGDMNFSRLEDGPLKDELIELNNNIKNGSPDFLQCCRNMILESPVESIFNIEQFRKSTAGVVKRIQKNLKNTGIFCATVKNDNLLMWAHYADKHRGAVVGFAPGMGNNSVFSEAMPIRYSSFRPLIYRNPRDCLEHILMKDSINLLLRIAQDLLNTKSLEWSYEQEYRVMMDDFIPPKARYKTLNFHAQELASLYLGCRMPEKKRRHLIDLARKVNPDVSIFEVIPSKRNYEVELQPYCKQ